MTCMLTLNQYFTNHVEIHLNKKVGGKYEDDKSMANLAHKIEDDTSHA